MLKIIDIYSDEGIDLEKFKPKDTGFITLVELEIGIENQEGTELFRFNLCDKKGLLNFINEDTQFNNEGIVELGSYNIFVVKEYNYVLLIKRINELFEKIYADDKSWNQLAYELSEFFYWEYQNELTYRMISQMDKD